MRFCIYYLSDIFILRNSTSDNDISRSDVINYFLEGSVLEFGYSSYCAQKIATHRVFRF